MKIIKLSLLFMLLACLISPSLAQARRVKELDNYKTLFPIEKMLKLGITDLTIETPSLEGMTRVDLCGNNNGRYSTLMRLEFSFTDSLTLEYTTQDTTERDKDDRHRYIMANLANDETSYQDTAGIRVYFKLKPMAMLYYSAIEDESLRGNGIGIDWYENHVEPYILNQGYILIGIWGNCLSQRKFQRFWSNKGFAFAFKVDPESGDDFAYFKNARPQSIENTEMTTVVDWYADIFAYVEENYEPDSTVYKFLQEARDPHNWTLHTEWEVNLGIDEAEYALRLSQMTIQELLDEYNSLEPDEFVHKDIGQALPDVESVYFHGHLIGRTIAKIVTYQQALRLMPEILTGDPSFERSTLLAKKKMLLFREWAYRHWDSSLKPVSSLLFNLNEE